MQNYRSAKDRLDDELDTAELLRRHIPGDQLYKVDRRIKLIAMIERIRETKEHLDLNIFGDED